MRGAYPGAISSFSLRGAQPGGPAAWQGCTLAAELLPSLTHRPCPCLCPCQQTDRWERRDDGRVKMSRRRRPAKQKRRSVVSGGGVQRKTSKIFDYISKSMKPGAGEKTQKLNSKLRDHQKHHLHHPRRRPSTMASLMPVSPLITHYVVSYVSPLGQCANRLLCRSIPSPFCRT